MDAIQELLADHRRFKATFETIARGQQTPAARRHMFFALLNELKLHESMEQREWYPHVVADPALLRHLRKEEKQAAKTIAQLKRLKPDTPRWWARFAAFKRDVLHHAHEEETALFPKVRHTTPRPVLLVIGENMRRFRESRRPRGA